MRRLHHGVGAVCTVLTRFIHPSIHVRERHKNLDKGHRTTVVLIGVDTKTVRRKEQEVYTFRADGYDNIILYAVKRYVNVVTEGNKEHFFEARDEVSWKECPFMYLQ